MWRIIPLCNIPLVHIFYQTKRQKTRPHIMQVKKQKFNKCRAFEALLGL